MDYAKPTQLTGDLWHLFYQEQSQIDGGKMDKFMTWSNNPGLVLSSFDATALPEGKIAAQYRRARDLRLSLPHPRPRGSRDDGDDSRALSASGSASPPTNDEPMRAVITAGGLVDEAFAREIGTTVKALAPFRGRTLLDVVVDACGEAGIDGVAVVGGPEIAEHLRGRGVRLIEAAEDGGINVVRALDAWPRERFVYLASDLPFATGAAVRDLIARSEGAALAMAIARVEEYERRFPGAAPHAVTLGRERIANGSAFVIAPAAVEPARALAARFFAARKNLFALARLARSRDVPALRTARAAHRRPGSLRTTKARRTRRGGARLRSGAVLRCRHARRVSLRVRSGVSASRGAPNAALLGVFWFGIQVVWTALLGVVLQDRATALSRDPVVLFSWLVAIGAGAASFVQIAAGVFSDRVRARTGNRRAFYAAGVALAVPAVVVLPSVGSVAALWIATLLLQLGMNVAGGPYQGIVGDYVAPERIGRASSWMSVQQFLGSVVGALLTALLRGPALGIALAVALTGGWLVTDRSVARLPRAFASAAPLRIDTNVRTVLASRALINLGFYTLFYYLFFFVHDSLRIADAHAFTGYLFVTFTVAGVAGAAIAGRAADMFDKRVVVSLACAAIALTVGALAAAPDARVALTAAAAAGIAWGAFFTADWAIAYAVLPRNALASAMGVWNLAATLPQVAAPALAGLLIARLDPHRSGLGPRLALVLVIVEFALGTVWIWRLPRTLARAAPDRRDR